LLQTGAFSIKATKCINTQERDDARGIYWPAAQAGQAQASAFFHQKIFFGPMPLFSLLNTQTMHINSMANNSIAMVSLKLWRDSNTGRLILRRMQCPLHHAARAKASISLCDIGIFC
jgi:hypothetical protein